MYRFFLGLSILESRLYLRIKHLYEEKARSYHMNVEMKNAVGQRRWNITSQDLKVCDVEIKSYRLS